MRERVEAMKAIWTEDEAEYHGELRGLRPDLVAGRSRCRSRTRRCSSAASGEKVLDRVLAYGDEWMPNRVKDPEELGERIAELAPRGGGRPRPRAGDGLRRQARAARARAAARPWASTRSLFYLRPDEPDAVERQLDELAEVAAAWAGSTSSTCRSRSRRRRRPSGSRPRSERLTALRLALGGKLPGYEEPARAAGVRGVRGLGRVGQGRRDQAPGRAARPAPRARRAVRARRRPTRSATTSCGASGRRCPAGAGWPCFDRSWYGRVLVERVEGFATVEQWERAYDEIVEFERSLCARGR